MVKSKQPKSQEDTEEVIEELQLLERNLQGIIIQKQSLQIEHNEISNALSELKQAKSDVYHLIGDVLIKSDKDKISLDLGKKESEFNLKISAMEKQEVLLEKKT